MLAPSESKAEAVADLEIKHPVGRVLQAVAVDHPRGLEARRGIRGDDAVLTQQRQQVFLGLHDKKG